MKTTVCAIYTRKSSDEGLDMEFNSLDAQREACSSYILSQKSEGWVEHPEQYDDGGYSGGTLQRPAITRLLEDIKAGKINTIIVYKIDRLTRSLADFSKLVDVFDKHNVTFVSVTQAFNTTTSMGRLTLNVLLSFAQFEREVTGERIRDKIAASKRRGMWMGGSPPIGYKIENKKLVIIPEEAELIRHIFKRYLELSNVRLLRLEITRKGILTPARIMINGKPYGDRPFSRGHLYRIISNPVYIGKISHKDEIHEGLHDGIIDEELWNAVQTELATNRLKPRKKNTARHCHYLAGKIYASDGSLYTPTYTVKNGRQYRYYLAPAMNADKDHPHAIIGRIACDEIEKAVAATIRENFALILKNHPDTPRDFIFKNQHKIPDKELLYKLVSKLTINIDHICIELTSELGELTQSYLNIGLEKPSQPYPTLRAMYATKRARNGAIIIETPYSKQDIFSLPLDELKRLAQGIIWRDMHFKGMPMKEIAEQEGYSEAFIRHTINKSFNTLSQIFDL